ncbi:cytochrome c-type biogenesis protein H1 [Salmonella enterica subsp. enterica serovar Bovismorbificans]|uniref:Cytochrome c-type biogenesis protein H1 n=1 Tax=Salmonella enterica subsp. enterica serovar Bovismorbificans TaxID=58097 RepID=A0A655ESF8_SALET|nr:cytochrome c-type biogenesis protein H1 [Salmonella enterica subsp. enterica serovar Bovismorbificans]
MARLALGLRTRLQNDAGNVEGWLDDAEAAAGG